MNLIAWFNRIRLAQTRYWLPYEQQLHECLFADQRLADLHPFITDQVNHLYIAYRSRSLDELAATYSYQTDRFWDVCDEFTLCKIRARNATGAIRFGGGVLAEIRIKPNTQVNNPKKFRLYDIHLDEIEIPMPIPLPPASGWVAELERCGVLVRHDGPTSNEQSDVPQRYLTDQYTDLFTQCSSASVRIDEELFHFLTPSDLSVVEDRKIGSWVPILDLRELGGLAITRSVNGLAISFMDDTIVWSEDDLPTALKRLHSELGT